jgi:hypothetical protein
MASSGTPFSPYTEKDLFDKMILKKRDLIATANLKWVDEMPSDPGVAALRCCAHLGGLLSIFTAERTKQNYILYAIDDLAVHATTRALGYKIRGSLPAKFEVTVVTNGVQTIPTGSILTKETSDGTTLKFMTLSDLAFTGADTKKCYVLQGETHTAVATADGTEFQEVVINDFPVAYGSVIMINDGNIWTEVTDFIDSTSISKHYVVEYEYTGQPTVITGDGEFGVKPESGTLTTIAWRTCDGAVGNLAPGELTFEQNFANVTSVTNEAPVKGELKSDVAAGVATIELVDDGSITGFLDSGVAYIGEDSFSYTAKVSNTFTGCSGLEEPHLAGEEVVYCTSYTYGANRETNKQAKVSAIRFNRTRGSAKSLLDYQFFAEQVPSVARARAVNSNGVITVQVLPTDAGIPSSTLLDNIYAYLAPRKDAMHSISIINPVYAYIDVTVDISVAAGNSFTIVKPLVLAAVQEFLNPLTTDEDNLYYINGWGNLLKKNLLEARIFYLADETLVSDVEITLFKRSTAREGSDNIQLDRNEIAHVGKVTVHDKDALFELGVAETPGYPNVTTLPRMKVEIL